jgi:hypothetical protein
VEALPNCPTNALADIPFYTSMKTFEVVFARNMAVFEVESKFLAIFGELAGLLFLLQKICLATIPCAFVAVPVAVIMKLSLALSFLLASTASAVSSSKTVVEKDGIRAKNGPALRKLVANSRRMEEDANNQAEEEMYDFLQVRYHDYKTRGDCLGLGGFSFAVVWSIMVLGSQSQQQPELAI